MGPSTHDPTGLRKPSRAPGVWLDEHINQSHRVRIRLALTARLSARVSGTRLNMQIRRLVRWVALGLTAAAVAQELRKPPGERRWTGTVGGFVPYDFRVPTLDRARERLWNPDSSKIVSPQVFRVGWSLNFGRLARLAGLV
jgi:hypothetical protein